MLLDATMVFKGRQHALGTATIVALPKHTCCQARSATKICYLVPLEAYLIHEASASA